MRCLHQDEAREEGEAVCAEGVTDVDGARGGVVEVVTAGAAGAGGGVGVGGEERVEGGDSGGIEGNAVAGEAESGRAREV